MGEHRLFAQRIGLVGLLNLLIALSSIFLLPILTKTLTIAEYGIWAQIIVTIGLIPSIVMFGLPYSMVRFLAVTEKKEDVQEGFYSVAFVVLHTSAIASLLLFVFSKPIASMLFDDNYTIAELLCLIVFVECLNVLSLNFFRTSQQIKKYSILIFIQTYLTFILVSYFVLSGHGIVGAATGILITRIFLFLIMASLIVSEIGFKIPKFANMRDYLAFGLPTVPGNLSGWVVNSSDRYVIGLFLGTAFVGYYSPGYALGSAIQMFVAPLGLILPAILSKYYDENKIDEAKVVLKFSLKYFLLFAIPSSFGLSLLSKPLLTILSTPEIASEGYLITPFVAIGSVFFGASVIVTHIIVLEKKTTITGSIYILAAILNFGLNLVFIPYMGIIGAAVTTLVAYLSIFVAGTYYSFKYIKFNIDLKFVLKSIFASIMMSSVILKWNPEGMQNVLATVGVCAFVYAVVLLLLKGMTIDELIFFKNVFKS
ncbi:MAG TPA: flippase [Methanothrix sp.]|nr:flippase [Methanothrix sp.]